MNLANNTTYIPKKELRNLIVDSVNNYNYTFFKRMSQTREWEEVCSRIEQTNPSLSLCTSSINPFGQCPLFDFSPITKTCHRLKSFGFLQANFVSAEIRESIPLASDSRIDQTAKQVSTTFNNRWPLQSLSLVGKTQGAPSILFE